MNKTVEYYVNLPYTLIVLPDDEAGGYDIEVAELAGCVTFADRWEDIPAQVKDAIRAWVDGALATGDSIPEPRAERV
ncbi:MAG: type II toxin-antitoxin system HicB family antitoxin [Anaerolineae bacterium]|nr:type II toxin-antitoxin system HicB family antitoxin [Anaerolineae bacterium]